MSTNSREANRNRRRLRKLNHDLQARWDFVPRTFPEKSSGYGFHTHTSYRNGKKEAKSIAQSINLPIPTHSAPNGTTVKVKTFAQKLIQKFAASFLCGTVFMLVTYIYLLFPRFAIFSLSFSLSLSFSVVFFLWVSPFRFTFHRLRTLSPQQSHFCLCNVVYWISSPFFSFPVILFTLNKSEKLYCTSINLFLLPDCFLRRDGGMSFCLFVGFSSL